MYCESLSIKTSAKWVNVNKLWLTWCLTYSGFTIQHASFSQDNMKVKDAVLQKECLNRNSWVTLETFRLYTTRLNDALYCHFIFIHLFFMMELMYRINPSSHKHQHCYGWINWFLSIIQASHFISSHDDWVKKKQQQINPNHWVKLTLEPNHTFKISQHFSLVSVCFMILLQISSHMSFHICHFTSHPLLTAFLLI